MSLNKNHKEMPPNAKASLNVGKQFSSSQEKRGDDKLRQACELVTEVRTFCDESDLKVIDDQITQ